MDLLEAVKKAAEFLNAAGYSDYKLIEATEQNGKWTLNFKTPEGRITLHVDPQGKINWFNLSKP